MALIMRGLKTYPGERRKNDYHSFFFFKVSSELFPFLIAKAHSGHLSY